MNSSNTPAPSNDKQPKESFLRGLKKKLSADKSATSSKTAPPNDAFGAKDKNDDDQGDAYGAGTFAP